ncbi:MAG: T9SS type A sorting domain-containing protein [Bacteroidia bacterium]|nr:T9SS type A sorting domain-containing protein [Bacteroidia bacterium]
MEKTSTTIGNIRRFALLFSLIFYPFIPIWAQAPTSYIKEVFATTIPYNIANPNKKINTTDWVQGKITGLGTAPNDFQWVTLPANAAAVNQNVIGFPLGAGFVRYINRNTGYPTGSPDINFAAATSAAFLATRSFDFSGHTTYNAAGFLDTIGISIFRDNSAGPAAVLDYVEVYLNTTPDITGATLLDVTHINAVAAGAGINRIHRSSTQAPVAAIAGWNRYTFQIPNLPAFVGASGGNSSVYVIVKGYSAGGNNIYFDNFNIPEWATTQVVTGAELFYQEGADVGKGSTDQVLLGLKVKTRGSLTPLRLDGIAYSVSQSTAWATDVTGSASYFTGGSPLFNTTGGPVSMPVNAIQFPGSAGLLNFGWYAAACAAPLTPVTMALNPGEDNYVWFVCNVAAGAVTGNFIGAELQFAIVRTPVPLSCLAWGQSTSSANVATTPIPVQSFGIKRQVDQAYNIPTMSTGTSWAQYNSNDFISAVKSVGENPSIRIDNYLHDVFCAPCLVTGTYCNRFACHPPDYTQFKPENKGPYMERTTQYTVGEGVRTGSAPYILQAQCGTWPSSNGVAVFIDWNKDGDFDDTYTGAGGPITENYGTKVQVGGVANMILPLVTWAALSSWNINVPAKSDVVADAGDVNQLPHASIGPIFLGNVRLRVREVFASSNIHPFQSYTFGETEDYTVTVLDDCPTPTSNVCKWLGSASNDWGDPSNWCPAKPTFNDVAYIPITSAPFFYPTIKDTVQAGARMINIQNGARLNIDAANNASLRVLDDINIGFGASAGYSSLNVTSSNDVQAYVPGKTTIPPLGTGLATITPFRTNSQGKTQIQYTQAELASTYGWKVGDRITHLSFEVHSITLAPAAPSSWQNFRIRAFSMTSMPVFPFPLVAGVKVAVEAADVNVASTTVLYGGAGTTLNLNMPNAAGGTEFNGNFYTVTLTTPLVWDGNDLVLSFEYNTQIAPVPLKTYVLYVEATSGFRTLALNFNAPGATITGWNIDGQGRYSGGAAAVTGVVSAQRPRIKFRKQRPYQVFPITIGGDIYNNNNLIRTQPYDITPVYSLVGDSGFVAGYSHVIFDPVGRNLANSPGLLAPNPTYYTGVPGLALTADAAQEITSSRNSSTIFNRLTINKVSAGNFPVRQASATANALGALADSLALANGEFMLNGKEFRLKNGLASHLVTGAGWLRSEDAATGNMNSKFTWAIGTNTGVHSMPFKGGSGANIFDVIINPTSGDLGNVTVATYATAGNNTPYANPALPAPTRVLTMTTNPTIVDATPWTVDRFWYIGRSTAGAITGTMTFEYNETAEGTGTAAYAAGNMKAQRYELTGAVPGWSAPVAGQTDASAAGISSVTRPLALDASYVMWAIINNTVGQAPLPITLLNFDAKPVDKRVKLWWDVITENNVVQYEVERTADLNSFEPVLARMPLGPSANVLRYDGWDNTPLNGLQYYRLATAYNDGNVTYSKAIPVRFGADGSFVINSVVTNQDNSLLVNFTYDSDLPYNYMITDLMGRVVAQGENNHARNGENSIKIPVALSNGIYTISLINADKVVSQKLFY